MCEAETGSESKNESLKLFVSQIPKQMTESELISMFEEFFRVDEVNIIKDKATKASRGCCFLICPSKEEADKAIAACHNKKTLPGTVGEVTYNGYRLNEFVPQKTSAYIFMGDCTSF